MIPRMVPASLVNRDDGKQGKWSVQSSPGQCVLDRKVSHTEDRKGNSNPGFALLALVDMAKALVLLAGSLRPVLPTLLV